MRIRRVRINSFGGVRDRDYRFGEGLTVMYGPNESGKTSTMEFIREVLAPSRKRDQYPKRAKTDSGILDIDDRGTDVRLELSSKDVVGERPACVQGMDESVFRTIFAMDPDTLDNADTITKGELKSRFLTVPGGERMAEVTDAMADSVKGIVGLRSNSDSELRGLQKELPELEKRISSMRSEADRYGELSSEIASLEESIARLRSSSKQDEEAKRIHDLYESNADNYRRLEKLREDRTSLGPFVTVTAEDIAKRDELERNVVSARAAAETVEAQREELRNRLDGVDRRKVAHRSGDIEALQGRVSTYREAKAALERTPVQKPQSPQSPGGRRMLLVAGIVIAIVGIAAGIIVTPYAFAATAVGACIAVAGLLRSRAPAPAPTADDGRARHESEVRSFESTLGEICSDLGVPMGDPESTLSRLVGYRQISSQLSAETEVLKARNARLTSENALAGFYTRFSGEDGYKASLTKTRSASTIDGQISAIEQSLRNAGLDPAVPVCPVAWEDKGITDEMNDLSSEMGRLKAERDAILRMDDLEKAMDRLAEKRSELSEVLARGAVAVLASAIAEEACSEAYGSVQPGVLTAANRYLGPMTGGRYSIEVDPRTNDISVRSDDDTLDLARLSSGTRAQVLLSLKLAIAREMGGGEVPVILDDVLLPFDSTRKEGAVRALSSVSSEMQVILFTCDAETRRLAQEQPGAAVLDMV
ncbi:MAG: AAA family ATPase [Thermoplasmata archaeon]|nr:AAA family ATPase [Thermoplasmata archaeon]